MCGYSTYQVVLYLKKQSESVFHFSQIHNYLIIIILWALKVSLKITVQIRLFVFSNLTHPWFSAFTMSGRGLLYLIKNCYFNRKKLHSTTRDTEHGTWNNLLSYSVMNNYLRRCQFILSKTVIPIAKNFIPQRRRRNAEHRTISLSFVRGWEGASRGHRGGFEGVSRGKPLGTPSKPSFKSLSSPEIGLQKSKQNSGLWNQK